MSVARVKAIEEKGVRVGRDYEYVGEVGTPERRRVDIEASATGVQLPFTAEEWCRLCMREGDLYVGGCCGTTSAMQDILNSSFRDSGWLDGHLLLNLGELARSHGDFDAFEDLDDAAYQEWLGRWDELDPWDKLGLCFQATFDLAKARSYDRPHLGRERTPEEQSIRVLERSLSLLAFADVFSDERSKASGQHQANLIEVRARALEPTRTLLAALEADDSTFEGYAICAVPGQSEREGVVDGYGGLAIYRDQAEAERVLALWLRSDEDEREDRNQLAGKIEIRPVRVSVKDGLEILDAPAD